MRSTNWKRLLGANPKDIQMLVNETIAVLDAYYHQYPEHKGIDVLKNDIIQAVKFDLGDATTDLPDFNWKGEKIYEPNLPYEKVYFEVLAYDGVRYGALLEKYEGSVCGQVLMQGITEEVPPRRCLFPVGLTIIFDDGVLKRHVDTELEENTIIESFTALMIIFKAIEVINCSNITVKDSKVPKFINQKRKAKGKLPLYSYKTLHLDFEEKEVTKSGNGTHASPRVHLRRGHIRKLPSGKTTWVQACVVGDKSKGVVHKDYSVAMH